MELDHQIGLLLNISSEFDHIMPNICVWQDFIIYTGINPIPYNHINIIVTRGVAINIMGPSTNIYELQINWYFLSLFLQSFLLCVSSINLKAHPVSARS